MKIIKEEKEELKELENPTMEPTKEAEEAHEEALKMICPIEGANRKAFLGAEKQPEPKEPELPKVKLDESLFEDYDENRLQGAIAVINRYFKGNLMRFLESMAYNCPIGAEVGEDFIVGVAEFLEEFEFDESLEESILSHYDDGLVTINQGLVQVKPCFLNRSEAEKLANRVVALSKNLKEEVEEQVTEKIVEEVTEPEVEVIKEEVIQEGEYGNKGNDEWQALDNKQSKEDKEEEDTLWDRVYSELATDLPHTLDAPRGSRYERMFIAPDGLGVYVEKEENLEFARTVAEHFGLNFRNYDVPNNEGTLTAIAGVVVIPEELYDETSEETAARLAQ